MPRKTIRLFGALLAGASLFAVACGGKSDGDDDAPGFLEESTFRSAFPTQLCALIASCCSRISAPISEAACRASAQEAVDDWAGDGTAYDGVAAAACLNGYASAFASCGLPSDRAIRACDTVYTGTVPAGAPCANDADCAGAETYCEPDLAGNYVCVSYGGGTAERAVEGEACAGSCYGDGFEPCAVGPAPAPGTPGAPTATKYCYEADGLTCDFSAGVCERSPGLGEPCDSYCAAGAYCDYEALQCVAQLPDGAACERSEQCRNRNCNDSLRCGPDDSGTITAELCAEF